MGDGEYAKREKKIIDRGFEIMLVIKGISCMTEVLIGVFLAMPISKIIRIHLINFLRHELVEYSNDKLLTMLYKVVTGYSMDMNKFMIVYMITHGLAKLLIVYLLYKKKVWAYPLAILILLGFAAYQMYKYVHLHSITLILLTVIDIVLIIFIYLEYKEKKSIKQ